MNNQRIVLRRADGRRSENNGAESKRKRQQNTDHFFHAIFPFRKEHSGIKRIPEFRFSYPIITYCDAFFASLGKYTKYFSFFDKRKKVSRAIGRPSASSSFFVFLWIDVHHDMLHLRKLPFNRIMDVIRDHMRL